MKGIETHRFELNDKRVNDSITETLPWEAFDQYFDEVNLENCSLQSIPNAFSLCTNLKKLRMKGNPLHGIHSQFAKLPPNELVNVLRSNMNGNTVICKEIKLMVVGEAAAGKTTLIRCLQGSGSKSLSLELKRIVSTDGIDLGELKIGDKLCIVYDFAGQEMYSFTHIHFFSNECVCMILFDLTKPPDEVTHRLIYWLNSIKSKAPDCACVIVGTHLSHIGYEAAFERCKTQFDVIQPKYSIVIRWAVCDSLSGEGLEGVKEGISILASLKVNVNGMLLLSVCVYCF